MALFSRRPKENSSPSANPSANEVDPAVVKTPDASPADTADASAEHTSVVAPTDQTSAEHALETSAEPAAEAAASVNISVTSFGGLGPAAAPTAPQLQPRRSARAATKLAPASADTVAGLRDNALLREALARLGDGTVAQALLDVARQTLQGHLFLRVKGDARTLLAEGRELPLAVIKSGDRQFALAFSSGAALQASVRADGDVDTSAVGQPALAVLRHVLAGPYEGLILDQASEPARAVLPRPLLEKLVEKADDALTVKTLLAGERTAATPAAVAEALTRAPLWVALGKVDDGRPGLAEGRAEDGSRFLEVYSHPIEVAVMGRGDQAAAISGAQLARALEGDTDLSGVVVDPAGPWIRLTREELAPVLASR